MRALDELLNIKEEIIEKRNQLKDVENDLKNIEKIALDKLPADLKGKIEKLQKKIENDEKQLNNKVETMDSLKTQLKTQKTIITQYVKGVSSSEDKTKKINLLKDEIINLKASIEATHKVLEKLNADKSKNMKSLIKEITAQRREMLAELKKEIKLLEQVYDYKMKGKI